MVADPVRVAAALLTDARDITLLAHVQPDADSLGSALALGIALHRRGADVRVSFATPDAVPETLRPLDVLGLVVPPSKLPARPALLVACDAAEPSRLGHLRGLLDTADTTVMIDHHASNPGFGDVRILDASVEATVVLVHRLLGAMGVAPDADVARCLYAGLVTDTRGFRTAGAAAHRMAAELIEAGVDVESLVRPIMDTHPYPWLAVLGSALDRCVLDRSAAGGLGLAYTTVRAADVARFRVEEVDGVVDVVRTVAEAEVAAVLKQVGERRWSVSLRSNGSVDVATAAGRIGGGGHRAAAGVTLDGTEEDVLHALRGALEPAVPVAG
ncbi:DHH family phosphoesterase [Pseudonocardia abyssalis]|uniref:DHH family phosphoesterase n=1 Tax=Pseudonocardia abyssalis TaxID=2792008 RepID=A0ABS6UT63_9PSEU|nr:DHH family phosphoesterase [Pseudonocardia abyssalis]MBW0114596.1 DHH family phosphoesterase [Pseudonocardia abyssalis]MBW0135445.1 DHH family phosphoesterase [Pseudonocardia abyssalis]